MQISNILLSVSRASTLTHSHTYLEVHARGAQTSSKICVIRPELSHLSLLICGIFITVYRLRFMVDNTVAHSSRRLLAERVFAGYLTQDAQDQIMQY